MNERTVHLLGPVQVAWQAGEPPRLRSQRTLALLGYLVAEQRPVARDALAPLFWPDEPPSRGKANLRRELHNLGSSLPACWQTDRKTVEFVPGVEIRVDLHELLRLEATGQWVEAAALVRGDFLEGIYLDDNLEFESWLLGERERWRQRAERVLSRAVEAQVSTSDETEALRFGQRLLQLMPWHEQMHRQVMALLAQQGQRSAALRQYAQCKQVLQEELAVEVSPATQALYERLRDASPFALHNIPAPITPLIGRERELALLQSWLRDSTVRLITITGAGGMGKTRLALALARHYLDQLLHPFTDGIYFVSLASLDDPARIISTIADVLNLRLQSRDRRSPRQQLLDYLQRKQMLLLLDNYEQLLSPEGIAPLLTLLSSAPGLTLLVTSRERLNIQGEQLFVVEGLRTPHAELMVGDRTPDEVAQAYSALQLFVHSARRVQPRFRLTSENLPAVVRVCQLVEGLPLAIELAAAWTEVLAPAQIAAEIEHSLDFLVAAWRDAPPRHRSLRAVFDSTWQRLSPTEQHVFARLSIFRGGFTRAAVEAVTGASWHVLLRLVDQALLAYQAERDRYKMHELLRQYATEQLPPDEAVLARNKHLTFFTELAEEAEPQLQGLEVATWLKRLDRDHDNLRTALQWMLDRGEAAWALRCCGALARFWLIRGYLSEGRRWVEAALTKGQQVAPHIQAKARFMAGLMAFAQSDYVHAATRYEESLAGFWEVSDQQRVAEVLLARATLLGALEDERYVAALEESLALLRETGHTRGMAEALRAYGRRLANAQHDFARAMALCQQSLALAREVGDQFSIADALNSCGLVADEDGEGDLEQAQAYYEESLALGRALGHPMVVGKALNNLGEVARFLGEYERAVAYYEECLALWRQAGHSGGISVCLANLGVALLRTGDVARASACFKEGLPLSHDLGDSDKGSAITCLSGLAMIASLHGQPQRAARLIGAADALVKTLKWPLFPLDASEHDRNVATVRAHVDEATFEAAWEAGRAMSLEQAMADALYAVVESEP